MAHYLITGGCGFIGTHLARALLAHGHQVRVLDNLSTGRPENAPAPIELMIGDVADRVAVRDALCDVDGAFHLAAIASVERSTTDWVGTHLTNLTGAITVFDAARNASKGRVPVVYASSAAVYGQCGIVPLDEETMPAPMTPYGADKLGCELHARVATALYGVPTIGLRFFNVYGPGQDPRSPYSGVISVFCDRIAQGGTITIHGDGQQVRDFIHVSDVVRFLVAAMASPMAASEVYNICTGHGTSIIDLARLLGDVQARPVDFSFVPARTGDIRTSIGNAIRAQRRFGIEAEMPLRDGLAGTLASLRDGTLGLRRYA